MPKIGMQPIRRRQLIEAAIQSIGEVGFERTTVVRIGRIAGVAPSIIHHYFSGKNDLLEATMRELLEQFRGHVVSAQANARTPIDRVEALIGANFADEQFKPTTVAAWLAFWAQAPHYPALHRLQRINARRLRSNLRHALRALLAPKTVAPTAEGLAAMIDGLYLNCALDGHVDGRHARRVVRQFLCCVLAASGATNPSILDTETA
ncbi:MAG: transcriptional regulator BetI [Acidihalobacter sp.]|uniref:transcriptional regulator BetI n=1 Tax=Acidihalobacter sp. TaxID=1872108 RepID=UPI00307EB2EE